MIGRPSPIGLRELAEADATVEDGDAGVPG
jgi:hypothetical protein